MNRLRVILASLACATSMAGVADAKSFTVPITAEAAVAKLRTHAKFMDRRLDAAGHQSLSPNMARMERMATTRINEAAASGASLSIRTIGTKSGGAVHRITDGGGLVITLAERDNFDRELRMQSHVIRSERPSLSTYHRVRAAEDERGVSEHAVAQLPRTAGEGSRIVTHERAEGIGSNGMVLLTRTTAAPGRMTQVQKDVWQNGERIDRGEPRLVEESEISHKRLK